METHKNTDAIAKLDSTDDDGGKSNDSDDSDDELPQTKQVIQTAFNAIQIVLCIVVSNLVECPIGAPRDAIFGVD